MIPYGLLALLCLRLLLAFLACFVSTQVMLSYFPSWFKDTEANKLLPGGRRKSTINLY
jgi:hypothetical protein